MKNITLLNTCSCQIIISNKQYHRIHVILKDFHIEKKNKLCLKKVNIIIQNILLIELLTNWTKVQQEEQSHCSSRIAFVSNPKLIRIEKCIIANKFFFNQTKVWLQKISAIKIWLKRLQVYFVFYDTSSQKLIYNTGVSRSTWNLISRKSEKVSHIHMHTTMK